MLKDITLGQYYPASSPLHRVDPRIKILLSIVYIVALFMIDNVLGYIPAVFALALSIVLSRIPFKTILRGMKPVLFILVFTAVINVFWTKGETPLFTFWKITVYPEGIFTAVFMALRVVMLIVSTSLLLTYTTTPIMLTNALESLLSPLKLIKIPVHDFAMMMSTALRFIPTLIEDADRIMDAQRARGASFSGGGLLAKARALIPILIPLFVSAFKRADDLSIAMECRCYRGGEGRTRMTAMKMKPSDVVWLCIGFFVIAVIIVINKIPAVFVV